jgi:hypothetical protein
MKTALPLLFFLLALAAAGQPSFTVAPNPAIAFADAQDHQQPAISFVYNLTDAPLALEWQRIEIDFPPNTSSAVATCDLEFTPATQSGPLDVAPGDSCDLHVYFFNFVDGLGFSAEVDIMLRNPAIPGDTAVAVFLLNPVVASHEPRTAAWSVYPNPAHDFFYRRPAADAPASLRLFTATGGFVERLTADAAGRYSLAGLPAGLYRAVAADASGAWVLKPE